MTTTTEQLETQVSSLAAEAFSAFCEDINGMFGVEAECSELSTGSGSFAGVKKNFKKLVSINHVEAKGTLEGTYNLMFDQAGTFIIAGIFVMLPEKRINEYVKSGTTKDTDFINDAIKEVGNLLVGSWDRIYREELEGHKHFKQSGTFVGNITGESDEEGLPVDEDCFYAVCEIKIDNFPKFKCTAVFPNSILDSDTETETSEETASDNIEKPEAVDAENETVESDEPVKADQTVEPAETAEVAAVEPVDEKEDVASGTPEPATAANGPVTEAIQQMTQAAPDGYNSLNPAQNNLGNICAKQIMNPAVLWADPEDTIEHIVNQMQQHNIGYMLVGKDAQIEGIASRSDIASAISPYTRSVFSHWRRPLDDASLQIRIKWFMTRPVQTISPDASLEVVIHTLSKHGIRALPVVDANGLVMGLITVFDIFKALTGKDTTQGQTQQTPPLV
ncbi:MAG: CBS domain-containing protein [Planctomycetota bacterium]|jgi:CBS domain-containing protein